MRETPGYSPEGMETKKARPTQEDFNERMALYEGQARRTAERSADSARSDLLHASGNFLDVADWLAAGDISAEEMKAGQVHGIPLSEGWEPEDYRVFAEMLRQFAESEYPKKKAA